MSGMTPQDDSYYNTLIEEFDMTMKRITYLDQAIKECTAILKGIDSDMQALLRKYKSVKDGI